MQHVDEKCRVYTSLQSENFRGDLGIIRMIILKMGLREIGREVVIRI
jgi:hypothetical protein